MPMYSAQVLNRHQNNLDLLLLMELEVRQQLF
jgi:hypothetical protein